ncbi:hypothetical protein BGV72_25775 [Burkholderia ubonensis]|nr:hypothetical protein BGV72_25775 [Burkholderia ubonensis]
MVILCFEPAIALQQTLLQFIRLGSKFFASFFENLFQLFWTPAGSKLQGWQHPVSVFLDLKRFEQAYEQALCIYVSKEIGQSRSVFLRQLRSYPMDHLLHTLGNGPPVFRTLRD